MEMPSVVPSKNRRRVCFSFAAYSKTLIDHLKTCKIPVLDGLSDMEFAAIESSFGFVFPPDLRSILREGLPIGPGFPNWRSSPQQLQILVDLPITILCSEISKRNFWCRSWGTKPENPQEALILAKNSIKKSPILVPIYRHCYIPSEPNLAGNPVFYVRGSEFRYSGFDVAGFFQKEFRPENGISRPPSPAWAAKSARRIEFWSDLAEGKEVTCESREGTCGWWEVTSGDGRVTCRKCGGLEGWFEEMGWRLREGGWKEEEVREMMEEEGKVRRVGLKDRASVVWHVRLLSLGMRKAGWSMEDVVESLGFQDWVIVPSRGPHPC
ncbi:uncharacterized protein LOC131218805 [Magnolia sinica]|uniref:uncharacterized protein LOC131218805 n=1 Tax=Magnolia sinica TaxID=86752 RepID=UPI00265B3870|nr:uncharacterized protein LOC131218805 [Magnolia sinica]